jgi:hypothetical protein
LKNYTRILSKFFILGISLSPNAMGQFVGSVITQFNEKGCDAMTINPSLLRLNICSGHHQWTYISMTNATGLTVKMDANLFTF